VIANERETKLKELFRKNDGKTASLAISAALLGGLFCSANVFADVQYETIITYSEINTEETWGDLSLFGLDTLPLDVEGTFTVDDTHAIIDDGDITFGVNNLISASVAFGDTTWNETNVESFTMEYSTTDDALLGLTYQASKIGPTTADRGIILNFPLTIQKEVDGVVVAQVAYKTATRTVVEIPHSHDPEPLQISIDIKPNETPNCFNINGHGVVPVAIFGSDVFDVNQVDFGSLSFGGLSVRVRGNKGPLCSTEYSNGDAHLDLVCQFEDDATNWSAGETTAELTGNFYDGTAFKGSDDICVVP